MARNKIEFNIQTTMGAGLIIAIVALTAFGCKSKDTTQKDRADTAQDSTETVELPADFATFYEQFHSDSAYQMSHIIFPLEAYLADSSGRDSIARWTAGNWKVHKPFVADNFWDHRFEMPVEGMIQEFIFSRDGSFYLQRRFARSKNEWYLIYYSGMQSSGEDWK